MRGLSDLVALLGFVTVIILFVVALYRIDAQEKRCKELCYESHYDKWGLQDNVCRCWNLENTTKIRAFRGAFDTEWF